MTAGPHLLTFGGDRMHEAPDDFVAGTEQADAPAGRNRIAHKLEVSHSEILTHCDNELQSLPMSCRRRRKRTFRVRLNRCRVLAHVPGGAASRLISERAENEMRQR